MSFATTIEESAPFNVDEYKVSLATALGVSADDISLNVAPSPPVPTVRLDMTVSSTLEDFDSAARQAWKAGLAARLSVSVADIALTITASRRRLGGHVFALAGASPDVDRQRRRLQSNSLQVSSRIRFSNDASATAAQSNLQSATPTDLSTDTGQSVVAVSAQPAVEQVRYDAPSGGKLVAEIRTSGSQAASTINNANALAANPTAASASLGVSLISVSQPLVGTVYTQIPEPPPPSPLPRPPPPPAANTGGGSDGGAGGGSDGGADGGGGTDGGTDGGSEPAAPSPPVDGVGADQADSSGGGGMGVALGGVGAVLALCCVGGFVYYRRRKRKQHEDFFIGAMIAESDSNKGNKGGSGADLRALARRGSKRKTAIGCNVGGEAMSIVHVKGDSQPAPPPATTSSERIYPLGRGASTLDAQQQADWVRRRSSIRKQLSSGAMGGEAPPPIPTAAQTAKLAQLSPALKVVPNSPPVSHRKSSIGQEESLSPSTRTGSFGKRVLASAGNAMSRMLKRGGSRRGSSISGPGSAAAQAAAAMMKRESVIAREREELSARYDVPKQVLHVCKEIRETEAIYIADLQTALDVYARPAVERNLLSRQESQAIFCNLEELCRCAVVLYELMVREGTANVNPEGEQCGVIAHAFIQVTPFFKLYALYCRNYETALSTLGNCKKSSPGLMDFLAMQSQDPRCRGMQLESYLIKPVQRLTKYPLFWKDLLKSVPRTHPDRAALEKADELVRTVSQAVNEKLNEELARIKTVQMLSDLGSVWMAVIAPHRKLEVEFQGTLHLGMRTYQVAGYLLTDYILICQLDRRGKQTPWLLAPLDLLEVNKDVRQSAAEGEGLHTFGAIAPQGVPRSRLLHLLILPTEEHWLELPDEAIAYQIDEQIAALKEYMEQNPPEYDESVGKVEDLVAKLTDKRLNRRGGNRSSVANARASSARQSRATRRASSMGRSIALSSGSDRTTSNRFTDSSEGDFSKTPRGSQTARKSVVTDFAS